MDVPRPDASLVVTVLKCNKVNLSLSHSAAECLQSLQPLSIRISRTLRTALRLPRQNVRTANMQTDTAQQVAGISPGGVEVTHRSVVDLAEELGEDELVQHVRSPALLR